MWKSVTHSGALGLLTDSPGNSKRAPSVNSLVNYRQDVRLCGLDWQLKCPTNTCLMISGMITLNLPLEIQRDSAEWVSRLVDAYPYNQETRMNVQ